MIELIETFCRIRFQNVLIISKQKSCSHLPEGQNKEENSLKFLEKPSKIFKSVITSVLCVSLKYQLYFLEIDTHCRHFIFKQ